MPAHLWFIGLWAYLGVGLLALVKEGAVCNNLGMKNIKLVGIALSLFLFASFANADEAALVKIADDTTTQYALSMQGSEVHKKLIADMKDDIKNREWGYLMNEASATNNTRAKIYAMYVGYKKYIEGYKNNPGTRASERKLMANFIETMLQMTMREYDLAELNSTIGASSIEKIFDLQLKKQAYELAKYLDKRNAGEKDAVLPNLKDPQIVYEEYLQNTRQSTDRQYKRRVKIT